MLCQCCSQNKATTRVKTIVEGELKEYVLCPDCAQKMGYGKLFGVNPGSLLGGFLKNIEKTAEVPACPACGTTFHEVVRTGRVGCARCYEAFYDKLLPAVQRIHGNTIHSGKRPAQLPPREEDPSRQAEALRRELKKAVEEQEFERAAELRDRIRELERQGSAHE